MGGSGAFLPAFRTSPEANREMSKLLRPNEVLHIANEICWWQEN
jgi:hypothetical protein